MSCRRFSIMDMPLFEDKDAEESKAVYFLKKKTD